MAELGVALQTVGLSKRFGVVQALDRVDLTVHSGEVHALVGENGAGKSTLIHVLAGTLRPDAGHILLAGRRVSFHSAHRAAAAGIAAVFQELSLVGPLSVAENVFANRQPVNRLNLVRRRELHRRTREMLRLFDLAIDPDAPIEGLAVAEQQVVEVLKALSARPCVLLLDEPTSALTQRETSILFDLLRRLRQQGVAVVYISHHLQEVLELADRVTVLRDGRHVATRPRGDLSEREMIRLMVGRELQDIYGRPAPVQRGGVPRLHVDRLSRAGAFADVSFTLWPGEILGLAGLMGAGRTEVGRALFGAEPDAHGRVLLDGQPFWPQSPAAAMRAGVAYVTEDRKKHGLFLRHSVRDNLVAPGLGRFSTPLGWMRDDRIDAYGESCRQRYRLVTPDLRQLVSRLSGGNQQKVMLAAWIGLEPRVLIADEPTRGVDVGARTEIYGFLRQLAAAGAAVLLISSDLQEILGLSDRILVLRSGRVAAEFSRDRATEEGIIAAALGAANGGGQA
jgi:ABC-type sugar transport system ATPase subunit